MLGTGIAITRWRGGASSNGAQSLLSGETDGLALSFLDASAQIKDTTTPANVYNSAGRVSAGALVGPGGKLTYTAPSLKMTRQSDGVYRYQAHNLYLYSELLGATGSSGYTLTGATVTAGQSDSRGGTGAVALVEDGSTNYHRIINPVITTSTGSSGEFIFEAKAGTRSIVAVRWQDSGATNRYSFFNLSAATFVAATADFTGDVTDLGGGWFRCRIACAAQNTTPEISIGGATATTAEGDAVYAGSNGSTALYLGFAHWRRTPSVDSYIATTSAAKYDLPYEWDAAGSALGILVEESRTNLLPNFKNPAAWGIVNVTITAETAPDGTATAAKFEVTTSAATVSSTAATVSATSVTASVYIKKGSGATDANRFTVRNSTTSAMLLGISINYDTLAITYTTGSSGASLESVGGGWYRLVMIVTSGITSGDTIQFYIAYLGGSETAGEFCYVWGRQLEAGSLATSPIETFGSTVTRAADNISLATSAFTWATPATLFAVHRIRALNSVQAQRVLSVDDASVANVIYMIANNTAGSRDAAVTTASSGQGFNSVAGANTSDDTKQAFALATNDTAHCINGAVPVTDATVTLPAGLTVLRLGTNHSISNVLHGHLKKVMVLPRRMTNAELQTLTTP